MSLSDRVMTINEALDKAVTSTGTLLKEKNAAYGNSVESSGAIIKALYPSGVSVEQYDDFLVIVRILDKFSRIAKGNKKAFGEDPWKDVAGYALLKVALNSLNAEATTL